MSTDYDLLRQRAGLWIAPLAALAVWVAPFELPPAAHRLAAILAAVVTLWVCESLPLVVTGFLGVSAAVVLQVAPATEAFAPFADPLIFLFVGTFLLARAIFYHGLNRRFAYAILGLPGVAKSPGRILAAYAAVACTISMWISNTATVAMMFPIGVSLLDVIENQGSTRRPAPRFAAVLLLSNAFAASIGGIATPVGTPPNLIGIGFLRRTVGTEVTFFSWMLLGVPIVILLFLWAVWDLRRAAAREPVAVQGIAALVQRERAALGPWTRGQVSSLVAFSITVVMWVLPGVIALTAGQDSVLYRQYTTTLPEGVAALLGACLLFVIPLDARKHEFTLPWSEALKIDWWIVFLYGGGMALGAMAFKTGLAAALGTGLTSTLGVQSTFGLVATSTVLAAILSETTSNTAAANMVVPVVIAFAQSAGIDPVLPAIAATMGASLGFMMPVSTPCNAIVYGSGRVPLQVMMRHGFVLDVIGVIAIIAVVTLLGPLVF